MNEDVFNLQIKKFLKKVGIQSQRQIEMAVRNAIESGELSGTETLTATVRLTYSLQAVVYIPKLFLVAEKCAQK